MGANVCCYPLIRVYHWRSTVNCKTVVIPCCIVPWHKRRLDVQWNTTAGWTTIYFSFPVKPLTSENVNAKIVKMSRCVWIRYVTCHTCSGNFGYTILYFVHVDAWYFDYKQRFILAIWELLGFKQGILSMLGRICTHICSECDKVTLSDTIIHSKVSMFACVRFKYASQ